MAVKRKIITVPNGAIEKLCDALNVGKTTVYAALNYTSNSENARHIRRLAMSDYGGIEGTKVIF